MRATTTSCRPSDKAVVNDYIKATYGVDAATDAAGAKNVYGNVKFLNDL